MRGGKSQRQQQHSNGCEISRAARFRSS
jgi:hypothetical protein